ncbi:MAG: type II toxin-antitoxin system VapC family toxin [Chloroflexota bacterium]|nr:type II toxin-antitoxin system VapC family toxin [Chloroflexota bacterium]
MPYLVDTDWLIDHLARAPAAEALLSALAAEGVAISIISYMEVYQGTLRSPDPAGAQANLQALASTVPVLPLSIAVAQRCARLRESLRTRGRRVRPRALDLLIAATALEYQLTLVTRNVDDYRDIPDLELYLRETGEGGTGG